MRGCSRDYECNIDQLSSELGKSHHGYTRPPAEYSNMIWQQVNMLKFTLYTMNSMKTTRVALSTNSFASSSLTAFEKLWWSRGKSSVNPPERGISSVT